MLGVACRILWANVSGVENDAVKSHLTRQVKHDLIVENKESGGSGGGSKEECYFSSRTVPPSDVMINSCTLQVTFLDIMSGWVGGAGKGGGGVG